MCNSAMRPVCGSTNRTTAFTDRTSSKRGNEPSRDAVLESTTTRSSLQASAKVTRDVYWWLNRFDFGSARGIAVSRRGPNGLKLEIETTHGIVRWTRVASMA